MKNIVILMFILTGPGLLHAQKRLVVSTDGTGDHRTVQEAINAVPDNKTTPTEIFVKKGTYKERIEVPVGKINITLIGEDAEKTILTFDNYAGRLDADGKALGTSRSGSFYIYGAGFTAKNITFQNSAGPVGQAVAVFVAADRVAFFNCRFLGFQDTLYTYGYGSHQYYSQCYIEGTTDFIFGAGTCLFDDCEIFCKKGGQYITAASTPDTTKYGYVFLHCKISGSADDNLFHLGRPWRPYAKVVYLYCNLSPVIKDLGWDNWRNAENEKTAYYAEYKNIGPGYQPGKRVSWSHQLSDDEAKLYTKKMVLKGWEPKMP